MGIKRKNLGPNYELIGVFATPAAYLADVKLSAAVEGMAYYDTTLNYLRTYDGSSWSPAGMSGVSAGSLDDAAQVGAKITNTQAIEIEASASTSNLFILDANGTTNVDIFDVSSAGGSGDLINLTQAGTGADIRGTSDTWSLSKAGVLTTTGGLTIAADSIALTIGATSDMTMQFVDAAPGSVGSGLLIAGAAAHEQVQFGNSTYQMDIWFEGTADTNYMLWDGSANELVLEGCDIGLQDTDFITFGDDNDLTMNWDGTQFVIVPLANGKAIHFGNGTADCDIKWFAGSTGDWVLFDEGNALVDFIDVNLDLDDDAILRFGDSNDFTIQYDGSNDKLVIAGDDKQLDLGVNGAGFDVYWYTETNGAWIYLDEDNGSMLLKGVDMTITAGNTITVGGGGFGAVLSASSAQILTVTGNVAITGTLSVAGGFDLGGFSMGDDEAINFGDSNDFVLHYDSSNANLELDAAAANDEFSIGTTTDTDVRFNGSTGGSDVLWDSSGDALIVQDNAELWIGSDGDLKISSDNTNYDIAAGSANGIIDIGRSTNTDVLFHGASANADAHWDASADTLGLLDDAILGFGNTAATPDFTMTYDGGDLLIEAAAANDNFKFGATTNFDVLIYGATASNLVQFNTDDSALDVDLVNFALRLKDTSTSTFTFGPVASNVLPIDAGTANEVITIGNATNTDVLFNGGNAGRDAHWDSSANTLGILDSGLLGFGNTAAAPDFSISYDGNDLLVEATAANDDMKFGATTNFDLTIYGTTATNYWKFDTDDAALTFDCKNTAIDFDDGTSSFVFGPAASNAFPIDAGTANETINIGATTNTDVIFHGGNAGEDLFWDASGDALFFLDGCVAIFGTGSDLTISTAGATVTATLAAASDLKISDTDDSGSIVTFGVTGGTHGLDIQINSITAADDIIFDAADKTFTFTDISTIWTNDTGTYTLALSTHALLLDGTSDAATDKLILGSNGTHGLDISIIGQASGEDILFDAGDATLKFDGIDLTIEDDDVLYFGDSGEISMEYDEDGDNDLRVHGPVDIETTYCLFQSHPMGCQNDGTACSGTTGDVNVMVIDGINFEYFIMGTQTILIPQQTATGLNIGMDQFDNDGVEITQGITASSKSAFVVGTDAFHLLVKFKIGTVAGTDDCAVGFRTAEAYQANIDDYNNMAVLNVISGNITQETIDDNNATTVTDTTDDWADGETYTLGVHIAADRAVTYTIDGVAPSNPAVFSWDVSDVAVPFIYFLNAGGLAGAVELISWECGRDT